jgi:hypothetical protein
VVEAEDLLEIQEAVDSEAIVAQIQGVHQGVDQQVSETVKQDLHLLKDKAHLVEPQEEEQLEFLFQGGD